MIKRSAGILWLPATIVLISIIYSRLNSDIGYSPLQPVEYSHKVHSGDYGLKCLFCHHDAERGSFASIPTTYSCMVCHVAIKAETEKMKPVIRSYDEGKPIKWIRLNKLPEHVKFNHNSHVLVNIDCSTCHGNVETMARVYRTRDFTMKWCLDCHRNPEEYIIKSREISGIFIFDEKKVEVDYLSGIAGNLTSTVNLENSKDVLKYAVKEAGKGPENCSACHY